MDHHGTSADRGVIPNRDVTQDLRAGTDNHIVADGGMALAFLLAGTAECHALIQQSIVADFRRFADHYAHAVIDEASAPNGCPRMNLRCP